MRAILTSIKPRHNKNICNHIKWWEIRKLFPLDYEGWVYIYNTKDTKHGYLTTAYVGDKLEFILSFSKHYKYYGKVIGRFWCDKVNEFYDFDDDLCKQACLDRDEMLDYLGDKNGKAIHITKLEIFDKPKELSEFRHWIKQWIDCGMDCPPYVDEVLKPLTRAPQSWCYIEV